MTPMYPKVFRATIKSHNHQILGTFCYRVVNLQKMKRELYGYNMHEVFNVSERGGQVCNLRILAIEAKYMNLLGYRNLKVLEWAYLRSWSSPDPAFYTGGNGVFGPEIATTSFALLCGDDPGEQERDFFYVKEGL